MSLSDTIGSMQTGSYTVTRRAAGSYTVGVYTAGASSALTVDASVQDVTGRMLESLPLGQATEHNKVIFTRTRLYTRDATHEPDRVTIDGESWLVWKVEQAGILATFYRAWVSREALP